MSSLRFILPRENIDMSPPTRRLALGVEYNGSKYSGWQSQKDKQIPSVQESLEKALSQVANHQVETFCAGRTDSGVHSIGQVVHFDTTSRRTDKAWVLGGNTNLPEDISIVWARAVPDNFHARFSAIARTYRYLIYNTYQARSAIFSDGITHFRYPLDIERMKCSSQYLIGEHDFSAFRSSKCQSRTSRRNIKSISVTRQGVFITIDVKANAFLHHMVRNIIGTLIEVGRGRRSVEWTSLLLKKRDRRLAAATAQAKGLYLLKVEYPSYFDLLSHPASMLPISSHMINSLSQLP